MKLRRPEGLALCLAGLLPLLANSALAQAESEPSSGGRSGLVIEPRLSLRETLTDNLKFSTQNKDAALVSTLSPGIRLSSNSGRVRGSLDYALNSVMYSRSQEPRQTQNQLSARGTVDLIEDWFTVDTRASINQQSRSAFGTVSVDPSLPNPNQSEVYNLGISPILRGSLPSILRYQLTADISETRAKNSSTGDLSNRGLSLQLGSLSPQTVLGWSAFLSKQRWKPDGGKATDSSSVTGSLLYRPDPEWNFSLTAGRERNSFTTLSQQSGNTYGASAGWQPSPRTRLALDWSRHDYGNSHTLSFEHRMARTVWRISDTQLASPAGPQANGARGLSNYDVFYSMFASREPDPAKRDILVRQFLSLLGMDPNTVAVAGFANSTATLTRRQEASFALQGLRTTLTFLLNRNSSSRLDPVSAGQGDFADSNRIMVRGYTLNLAYRLTPTDSATVVLTDQQTRGDLASQRSDLKSLIANWNARLGPSRNITLGLRHSRFDSPTQPYRENAVLATFVQQF